MYSTFAGSLLKALILSSLLEPATAQTYSSCNPTLQGGCPADPALGHSLDIDFTSGSSSKFTASGNPTYDSNGAAFTVAKSGDAPSISSKWYIMFGHVDYVIKAAPGTGIVSAAILQSDCLDEIDWEWLGGDNTQAQSNYFGKGITTTGYNRGAFHGAADNHDTFHTYSIDWTADQIVWSIDGTTVRAMTQDQAESGQYPQTPMYVKLGAWAGGDPSNPQGTIEWAGGLTDYSAGPFTMYVKSVHVTDYSTGSQYSYSGTSGTWQSIVSSGGQINGEGDGTPVSSAQAPAVTSHVSNSAPLAFGNGDNTDSVSATRTGWPWSGTATATAVTVTQSPSSSSAQVPSSASESVSLEVFTSYDGQGFPTLVTIESAAPVTPKSYDSQGFLTTSTQPAMTVASSTKTQLVTPTTNTDGGDASTAPVSPASSAAGQPESPGSTTTPNESTISPESSSTPASRPSTSSVNSTEAPSTTPVGSIVASGTVTSSHAGPSSTTQFDTSSQTRASTTSSSTDTTLPGLTTTSDTDTAPIPRSTTTTPGNSNALPSSTSAEVPSKTTNTALPSEQTTTLKTSSSPSKTTNTALPSEQSTTLRTSSSPSGTQTPAAPPTSTGTPPAVNGATADHGVSGLGGLLCFGVWLLSIYYTQN